MAIIGPSQLPLVFKAESDPLKRIALHELGHPTTLVELTEDNFESAIRRVGDFITEYFPLEEKYAFFMTQPLQTEYPIPEDAYWIRDVYWDPATTRIDDIFGAESFLFCLDSEFLILDKDNTLQPLGDWKPKWKAKTPYGNRRLQIKNHKISKHIPKMTVNYGSGEITATVNHPIPLVGNKWREFSELRPGDQLQGIGHNPTIQNIKTTSENEAIAVRAMQSGVYYGCHKGEPILIH